MVNRFWEDVDNKMIDLSRWMEKVVHGYTEN